MSTVNYTNASNYYTTDQTSWYLEFWEYRDLDEDDTDYYIVLDGKYEYRPDLLAYDLYGDVKFWWIFSIMNKNLLIDPIYDLTQGKLLRIPTKTRLNNTLG